MLEPALSCRVETAVKQIGPVELDTALDRVETPEAIRRTRRIVRLPLSWDDPTTRVALERYARSVRTDAPWCPSIIKFIRRINGLDSIDGVQRIVFKAAYLVLGLGDVYLCIYGMEGPGGYQFVGRTLQMWNR